MVDDTSMSIATASKHARQNPHDAAAAIQTLFDYIDNGGTDAKDAAVSLSLVAGRAPEAFDSQTDNFEHALKITDNVHARLDLTEAVTELIDHHAIPPGDAGRALTEATRIRDDAYWEDSPKSELLIIRKGFDGWAEVATTGKPVPDIVVEQALGLIETRDFNTLLSIIDVLQAAVASDSSEVERAFQTLVEIAQADDPTLTSEATIAVAELILNGDIPDEGAAHDVITANADAVQREQQTIADAQAEITS